MPAPYTSGQPSNPHRHPICWASSPTALHLISSSDIIRAAQWADHQLNAEWVDSPIRLHIFIHDTGTHPSGMTLSRTAWVQLNHLRAGVWSFCSFLYKWGMASSAACECGVEEQWCLPMSNPPTSPLDCTAWRCWAMRQPHGCSTSALRSSAAKQWFQQLAQKKENSSSF